MLAFLWPRRPGGFGARSRPASSTTSSPDRHRAKSRCTSPRPAPTSAPTRPTTIAKAKAKVYGGPGARPAWSRASSRCTRSACTSAAACRGARPRSGSSARATARSTTGSARRRAARRRAASTASPSIIDGGVVTVDTKPVIQGPPIGTNTTGQEAEGPHCAMTTRADVVHLWPSPPSRSWAWLSSSCSSWAGSRTSVLHLRRPPPGSEIELAPNRRPYLDDEGLEGPRLDRVLIWSAVLIGVVAIGLPLYWVKEPARQSGAIKGFDKRAAARGFTLFQPTDSPIPEGNIGHFGCGKCHGVKGEGGGTTFTHHRRARPHPLGAVEGACPQHRAAALHPGPSHPDHHLRPANTPMPAWGIAGGGPMNDQQISDLVAYLKSIQLNAEDAKATEPQAQYGRATAPTALFDVNCAPATPRAGPTASPRAWAAVRSAPTSPTATRSASSPTSMTARTSSRTARLSASPTAPGASAPAACPASARC